jgi:hypothetical protein
MFKNYFFSMTIGLQLKNRQKQKALITQGLFHYRCVL